MASETLRKRYDAAGQGHVFHFLDKFKPKEEELSHFLSQLEEIDVERLNDIYTESTKAANAPAVIAKLDPLDCVANIDTISKEIKEEWTETGLQAIKRNEVGVILLAGGQGTRLGFDKPKGMYNIGLPSRKSLFQLMAERIISLSRLAGAHATIPWYIMTSPQTHGDTVSFFEEVKFFGLSKDRVFFFQQGTLPCLTKEGKIILDSAFNVATAPDGNGGIYMGLHKSGAIADMKAKGVSSLFVYSVDNAVVRVADPTFVGYCLSVKADVGSKVVRKAHAHEKVGVLAKNNGKYTVVEYSEMTTSAAEQKNKDGSLTFSAGNVCIHYYSRNFLETTCSPDNLPKEYHVAIKKIPYAHPETGRTIPASELKDNTGIKLESFIFDVFPYSTSMGAFEVPRASEFAPVKNAPGSSSDSPDTALRLITDLHRSWLLAAGVTLDDGETVKDGPPHVEISPLVSYGFGEKELNIFRGLVLKTPLELKVRGEGIVKVVNGNKEMGESKEVETLLDGKLVHTIDSLSGIHRYELIM